MVGVGIVGIVGVSGINGSRCSLGDSSVGLGVRADTEGLLVMSVLLLLLPALHLPLPQTIPAVSTMVIQQSITMQKH